MDITPDSMNAIIIASLFLVIINVSELNIQRKVLIGISKNTSPVNVNSNGSKKGHSNYNEVRTLNF